MLQISQNIKTSKLNKIKIGWPSGLDCGNWFGVDLSPLKIIHIFHGFGRCLRLHYNAVRVLDNIFLTFKQKLYMDQEQVS